MHDIRKQIWAAERRLKAWLVDLLLALAEKLGHRDDQFTIARNHFVEMPDGWWRTEITPIGRLRTVIEIRDCLIIPKDVARRAGITVDDA